VAGRTTTTTVAWAALLLAALGAIGWQLRTPHADDGDHDGHAEHASDAVQLLVAAPPADWTAVDLLQRSQRQGFERDAQGAWLRHAPVAGEAADHAHRGDPAEAARIEAVFATLGRARIERTLPADPARAAAYGLDNPALIVLLRGRDGRALQTLEFGDLAPDGLSRYVHLPQTRQLHTVPHYHLAGLLTLLAPEAGGAASAPAAAPPGGSAPAAAGAAPRP
jgi:hypothetical protein